jgi:hypothetical protein
MAEKEQQHIREKEQYWRNIEIVQLGQEFPLFDTVRNRTQVRYSDDGSFAGMKSNIRLETGFLGKLNISISAAPYAKSRFAVVTPFDPKQGYPIDTDDLSFHRRVAKISKMRHELAYAIVGLYLFVFVTDEDLSLNGRMQALLQENATLPGSDTASMLHHLFLTLKFPNGSSFTARATYETHQRLLLFHTFFPSDTGPLPNVGSVLSSTQKTASRHSTIQNSNEEPENGRSEGFDILLPFDLAMLKTIQSTFLFLPNLD